MTDRDAFLAAIHDAPEDDAPRLIFADWLDEHGEPERAEFIRIQVEMRRERETHDRVTPKLDELFLRQKQLFQCAWAEAARRCGAGAIASYSRGFPDILHLTAATFVEFETQMPLWIGPNTRIHLRECHGMMHKLAEVPAVGSIRQMNISSAWADETVYSDDDVATFFASPYLGRLREFQLSNPTVRRNSSIEAKPLTSKVAIAIASAESLTALEKLVLSTIQIRSAGATALARQERLATLRELYLDNTGLTKRGVAALCNSPHLRRLAKLVVSGNQLSPEDIANFNKCFPPDVVIGDQQSTERRRFIR